MKSVIFDFDGTLANTEAVNIYLLKQLAPKIFAQMEAEGKDMSSLKNTDLRSLMRKYNISYVFLLYKVWQAKNRFNRYIDQISLYPGIKDALNILYTKDNPVYLLSSNTKSNIMAILKKEGIEGMFKQIYTENMIFGKAKIINKLIKQNNLDKNNTIYIGDETRDIEASKAAGVTCIAVTWGFNSKEILLKYSPDFTADSAGELIKILANLDER